MTAIHDEVDFLASFSTTQLPPPSCVVILPLSEGSPVTELLTLSDSAMAVQSKVAPLPSWGYAVAGATGAVLANALVYPLDMYATALTAM